MRHTLHVLVEDTPCVLNRVASLFRRRACHVESLTFARTSQSGVSRIEVVIESNAADAARLTAYLNRLVDVLAIVPS